MMSWKRREAQRKKEDAKRREHEKAFHRRVRELDSAVAQLSVDSTPDGKYGLQPIKHRELIANASRALRSVRNRVR